MLLEDLLRGHTNILLVQICTSFKMQLAVNLSKFDKKRIKKLKTSEWWSRHTTVLRDFCWDSKWRATRLSCFNKTYYWLKYRTFLMKFVNWILTWHSARNVVYFSLVNVFMYSFWIEFAGKSRPFVNHVTLMTFVRWLCIVKRFNEKLILICVDKSMLKWHVKHQL